MPSQARALLDHIEKAADRAAFIRSWINSTPATIESEILDFKAGADGRTRGPLDDSKIKKIWSEALSGFGNTGGGVLVWGLDCRPEPSPSDPKISVDHVRGELLVPNVDALKSRLQELLPGATDNPLQGTDIVPIRTGSGPEGFVVCFVPEGKNKPYRAKFVTNEPYIMRTSASFTLVPHAFLRSLFFPSASPQLVLNVHYTPPSQSEDQKTALWNGWIENRGTATAYEVILLVQFDAHWDPLQYKADFTYQWEASQRFSVYRSVGKPPVHPGDSVPVFSLRATDTGRTRFFEKGKQRAAELLFTIMCKDQPQRFARIIMNRYALLRNQSMESKEVESLTEDSEVGWIEN